MSQPNFSAMSPIEFIEFLAGELKLDYDVYMQKLEDMPSSNSGFDYLSGYTDYCEETAGLVEAYLRIHNAKTNSS